MVADDTVKDALLQALLTPIYCSDNAKTTELPYDDSAERSATLLFTTQRPMSGARDDVFEPDDFEPSEYEAEQYDED